jgi:lysophospholipid acyltransferase (LPLAT)-like uncharacterized protein
LCISIAFSNPTATEHDAMLKRLLARPGVQTAIALVLAAYLRLVWRTSRVTLDPPSLRADIAAASPVIYAMWHGEHLLVPAAIPRGERVGVLISTHRDGELNARVASRFGIELVRGSGAHDPRRLGEKRGAVALREMVRAVKGGLNMGLTADVPKVAKIVGLGIVTLARMSGRPIVPVAVATSRRRLVARSWDQTKIPLPFGHVVVAIGAPVMVPPGADAGAMEAARLAVQAGLDETTRRAYERLGDPAAPTPDR